jgi:hypothetical protein
LANQALQLVKALLHRLELHQHVGFDVPRGVFAVSLQMGDVAGDTLFDEPLRVVRSFFWP